MDKNDELNANASLSHSNSINKSLQNSGFNKLMIIGVKAPVIHSFVETSEYKHSCIQILGSQASSPIKQWTVSREGSKTFSLTGWV